MTKTCARCETARPHSDFCRLTRSSDGLQAWCKPCIAEYKRVRRQAKLEYVRAVDRAYAAEYRRRHPDKIRVWKRLDYERAMDAYKARTRDWNEANRERRRSHQRTYKEGIKGADHKAVAAYVRLLAEDPCSYCAAPSAVVDHIVPLARGGVHAPDNLTAACAACNSDKRAKPLLFWLTQRQGGEAHAPDQL